MDEVDGSKKKDMDLVGKLPVPHREIVCDGKRVMADLFCTCFKAVTVEYQLQDCN